MKIYRKCTSAHLATDTTFPANNPLRFRKKLLDLL